METVAELQARILQGEVRALARAISLVEAGAPESGPLLAELRQRGGAARVIGVTGAPGSGKSTLTDALVEAHRKRGQRVAVVAVDPSSPFSGGAILGDRIRMGRWHSDPGVFIRSMAARGRLGGLAAATLQVVALLAGAGFGVVFVETVGVGQSEVEVAEVADSTLLVLTPGQGDAVQAFKAGIMEVADLFVINKADQPGAGRLRRELQGALELGGDQDGRWRPPIRETVATTGEGVEDLLADIDRHFGHLGQGGLARRRASRDRAEALALLAAELRRSLEEQGDDFVRDLLSGRLSAGEAAGALLRRDGSDGTLRPP